MTSPPIRLLVAAGIGCSLGLAGCAQKPAAPASAAPKPATTEVIGHETELLKLTLTPQAEARLGLKTVPVAEGRSGRSRTVHGEVIAAPFAGGVPATSVTDLATLSANQARADGDVARTRAELQVAQRAFTRAEALVREEAGSVRARDEAESALGAARANLAAAQAQRNLLGPRLTDAGRQGPRWVRAAAFASDLESVERGASASVSALGAGPRAHIARPVQGPPTANLAAGTVDLYYALPADAADLRVGQRVAVELPLRGASAGVSVPVSALLTDIYGGEWVYVRSGTHAYERRRVEIASRTGASALVRRGLGQGAEVVTAGAMELYGAEFGSK